MKIHYNEIVDKIYSLPLEDKEQLKKLLEYNIAETRRTEIAANYKQSKEDFKAGKLKFSSSSDDLKVML
jgi:hypothetical protein